MAQSNPLHWNPYFGKRTGLELLGGYRGKIGRLGGLQPRGNGQSPTSVTVNNRHLVRGRLRERELEPVGTHRKIGRVAGADGFWNFAGDEVKLTQVALQRYLHVQQANVQALAFSRFTAAL